MGCATSTPHAHILNSPLLHSPLGVTPLWRQIQPGTTARHRPSFAHFCAGVLSARSGDNIPAPSENSTRLPKQSTGFPDKELFLLAVRAACLHRLRHSLHACK